jgi:hypothetical protein
MFRFWSSSFDFSMHASFVPRESKNPATSSWPAPSPEISDIGKREGRREIGSLEFEHPDNKIDLEAHKGG